MVMKHKKDDFLRFSNVFSSFQFCAAVISFVKIADKVGRGLRRLVVIPGVPLI